jgi:molecular chaperone GrpE
MTESNKPKETDIPEGFTDVTGPAAFRAQILKEQETAVEEDVTAIPDGVGVSETQLAVITGLQDELDKSKDQLLRTMAEMENLRKRSQREREDAAKFAITSFAKDLLDVADTFRRALEAIPSDLKSDERIKPLIEGIEATEQNLLKSFERNGIKKIEPGEEPFNPNFHEVMFEAVVPGKAAGQIIQVIEAGYILNDRLLRPARVGVSKGDPSVDPARNVDTQA